MESTHLDHAAHTHAAADAELKRTRRELKELKRRFDSVRPLDSWERYRALNDAMDEAYDLNEISNREARLALMLMGGLNAGVILVSTRGGFVASLQGFQRVLLAILLAVYAVTAVYFMLQAIEALRPGRFRPRLGDWPRDTDDYPLGVRYYEDIIERDVVSHWRAWSAVSLIQLNAELAIQIHSLSLKNNIKRVGLRRLYAGLRVMTLLVTGILILFVYSAWR
jgi:hypothetical protein